MTKKDPPAPDDFAAFLGANPGMKPLTTPKRAALKKNTLPQKPRRRVREPEEEESLPLFVDQDRPLEMDSASILSYKHSSVSHKILRKLSKAQYNVEAVLDMHGMTAATAEYEVDAFLKHCLKEDFQVVLFIHGKGTDKTMPVLKNKLYQWLRRIDNVLAFHSAAPAQGGRGALIVLLKHKPQEREC